jgi:uncharacterized protein (DUF58 family)
MSDSSIFDPKIVGRVKGLEMRSFRLAESFMVGMHRSRLRGISTEFAQHRQYVIGDDTKHLDWKVFAKTDRFYIKEFEAETSLPVLLLVDVSPSMFFKSEDAAMSKFEYAATVAATLAYLLMQQKDTFGLALFAEKVRTFLPPRGSGSHFRNMVDLLQSAQPGGKTDVGAALLTAGPRVKGKGIAVVISDFVEDQGTLTKGLGQMSYLGHDVVLFHVEDPVERDFPFLGQTIFRGLEEDGRLLCDPEDLRDAYLNERERHLDAIHDICVRFRYDLLDMPTDAPIDEVLSAFLAERLARRRAR